MKVLIAEDDPHILEGLAQILGREGYTVARARDGNEALAAFKREQPDFVCLDVMMPGKNGYELCRAFRRENERLPIIFISAKTEEIDKVVGFEMGADDYITKPFGVREVVARIRAVTRRCLAEQPTESSHLDLCPFAMGDLEICPAELRARRGDAVIELSLRDVRLLELFYKNAGKALDRHALFTHAWGVDHIPNSRTLDQHISQLRKRIEIDPAHPRIIQTVHGVGYRFEG